VRNKDERPTKSRNVRYLPLVPAGAELLWDIRPTLGDGLVFKTSRGSSMAGNLRIAFPRIVRQAGIAHCTLHDLRRSFLSHLAMAGVGEAIVQKLAGQAHMSTTLKYYTRVFADSLRSAPAALPYVLNTFVTPLSPPEGDPGAGGGDSGIMEVLTGVALTSVRPAGSEPATRGL